MTDTTEPTAPPPDSNPPDSNPPGWLLSPYKMAPAIEGEAAVLAATERAAEVEPFGAPFDPTKPTIDQTRSNAITSIRDNFAALAPAATIDPTAYLPKVNPVTNALAIRPTTGTAWLTLDGAAGHWSGIKWGTGGKQFWDIIADAAGTYYLRNYDSAGTYRGNALVIANDLSSAAFSIPMVMFQPQPGGVVRNTNVNIDVIRASNAGYVVMETTYNSQTRVVNNNGNCYYDHWTADAAGNQTGNPGPPVIIRQSNTVGALQPRISFINDGQIQVNWGTICSGYVWYGGPATFTLEFKTTQTCGVAPGSVIGGILLGQPGHVVRIFVAGNGAITLPSYIRIPQGGAVWGTYATMISLWFQGGSSVYASFVPYD